jgi:predicted ATPase
MVIGTYRDAEARISPERLHLLARIAREATTMRLSRFDREEVSQFVMLATGQLRDDDRAGILYRQTEGNPLFLRELLRLHGPVPRMTEGIQEVVRARLALLDPDERRLLEAAAVIGREFGVALLAVIAEVSELDVRGLVEPAANAAIIEPLEQPPRWRFTHVLLRQGLYDDMPAPRRRQLHASAAIALQRQAAEPAEIAHHLVHAVPEVPAVRAAAGAARAAERAIELLAFEDARELYATAERLLRNEPGERRALFETILGAAHACMRMAEVTVGLGECERAARLAREIDDGGLFARAILMSTYELVPDVRDERIIAALEEALARLPPGASAVG